MTEEKRSLKDGEIMAKKNDDCSGCGSGGTVIEKGLKCCHVCGHEEKVNA